MWTTLNIKSRLVRHAAAAGLRIGDVPPAELEPAVLFGRAAVADFGSGLRRSRYDSGTDKASHKDSTRPAPRRKREVIYPPARD